MVFVQLTKDFRQIHASLGFLESESKVKNVCVCYVRMYIVYIVHALYTCRVYSFHKLDKYLYNLLYQVRKRSVCASGCR